jgi:adenylate cyclase
MVRRRILESAMGAELPYPSLALMFVDVSGSTNLYEALGDAEAHSRVDSCLQRLGRISVEFDGRVIKTAGDGAFFAFPTADGAMQAAGAMLDMLAKEQQIDATAVSVHIGCHFGPVIEVNGDLFGDAVNLASRIAGLAKPGQVILTDDAFTRLSPAVASRTRALNRVAVKGKREDIAIWEYLWQEVAELTALSTRAGGMRGTHLLLRLGGRETILGPSITARTGPGSASATSRLWCCGARSSFCAARAC